MRVHATDIPAEDIGSIPILRTFSITLNALPVFGVSNYTILR